MYCDVGFVTPVSRESMKSSFVPKILICWSCLWQEEEEEKEEEEEEKEEETQKIFR